MKILIRILIFTALLCIATFVFFYFLFKYDSIIYWASQRYPLDGAHKYYLTKNTGVIDKSGNILTPANVTYVIFREDEPNHMQDFGVNGQVIGKTQINLEKYVNSYVYITGHHYDGLPLILNRKGLHPQYYNNKMAVIAIESIIKVANKDFGKHAINIAIGVNQPVFTLDYFTLERIDNTKTDCFQGNILGGEKLIKDIGVNINYKKALVAKRNIFGKIQKYFYVSCMTARPLEQKDIPKYFP